MFVAGRPSDLLGCAVRADPQLPCGPLFLLPSNHRREGQEMQRVVGMDIHRTFAERPFSP